MAKMYNGEMGQYETARREEEAEAERRLLGVSGEKPTGSTGSTGTALTITDLRDAVAAFDEGHPDGHWHCRYNQSSGEIEFHAASTGIVPQGLSERERTLHGLIAGVEDGLYLVARGLEKLDEAMPSSEEDAVATEKWGALEKSFQEMWEYLEERLEVELCEQLTIQDEDNDCIPNGGE